MPAPPSPKKPHEPKRMVPRAIFFLLCMVGSVVLFNSAALTLSFNRDTLVNTSAVVRSNHTRDNQ